MSSRNIRLRFGERIRYLRTKAGLSQGDMSHTFGIDRSHISDLENGKKEVCLELIETIADGFKISISELMKGV